MSRIVWIEMPTLNPIVTHTYLKAIGKAYILNKYKVKYYNVGEEISNADVRNDIFVVATAQSVLRLASKGSRHIVLWVQGLWAEESRLRNGGLLRYKVVRVLEKIALEKCEKVFLVSNAMLRYYQNEMDIDLRSKAYIMPCSNEVIHDKSFYVKGKYETPSFVYAGGLQTYQCISETFEAYSRIEKIDRRASLTILTPSVEEAESATEKYGLKRVRIEYVTGDDLVTRLSHAKYGFVIRDDSPVNRVSTPTKISSYISNGVIPIYSKSIVSFSESFQNIRYQLPYNRETFERDYQEFEKLKIESDEIAAEYADYFNRELDFEARYNEISTFLTSSQR